MILPPGSCIIDGKLKECSKIPVCIFDQNVSGAPRLRLLGAKQIPFKEKLLLEANWQAQFLPMNSFCLLPKVACSQRGRRVQICNKSFHYSQMWVCA